MVKAEHDVAAESRPGRSDAHRPALDMPARRIGELLARSRSEHGESLLDVADRIEWRFTPLVLRMIEAGAYPLAPADVATLMRGYCVELGELRPRRDRLTIGDDFLKSGPHLHGLVQASAAGRLLHDYVRFVRDMRGLDPGASVRIESVRIEDLEVLAETLRVSVETVEACVRGIIAPRTISRDDCVRIAELYKVPPQEVEAVVSGLCGRGCATS